MALDKLTEAMINAHPEHVARTMAHHPLSEQINFIKQISSDQKANLISHLPKGVASELLATLAIKDAADAVCLMSANTAATLIRGLSEDTRSNILATLPTLTSRAIKMRLTHARHTVGALVDSHVFTLSQDMTAGEALKLAKAHKNYVNYEIYVLNPQAHIVGHIDIKDLWLTDTKTNIGNLVIPNKRAIRAEVHISKASEYPEWEERETMPVCNKYDEFIGVVHQRELTSELIGLFHNDPKSDIGFFPTVVALSELFWNAGAEFLANHQPKKGFK